MIRGRTIALAALAIPVMVAGLASPQRLGVDESVFVKGLKPGERESILYIWTRDADHQQSDFLAVVDVDPESDSYGRVIGTAPAGAPANEAHHFGYTVNADRIFAGGSSRTRSSSTM